MTFLLAAVVFVGAGLFGMLGLSGAVVYVPLLSWWGFDFKTGAIPLSVLLGTATAFSASIAYLRAGLVNVRASGLIIITAVGGAPLGAAATRVVPAHILKMIFAVIVIFVAARIFSSSEPGSRRVVNGPLAALAGLAIGFLIGFSSGLLGVGGGFILLPTLMYLGYPTKEAVATSSTVVAFSTLAAFLSHIPDARFNLTMAALLVFSAVAGSGVGGAWAARSAKPLTLRLMAGTLLAVIATRLLYEAVISIP